VRYQITSVLPFGMFDTIIQFRAQPLTGRFGHTVLIAVDHRPARAIREALASGIRPIVEPESWQVWA
jgi:hypothetical protein